MANDAAYEKGYYEQGEFLDGKSHAEAEEVLRARLATLNNSNSYNAGALAATRDYLARLEAD